MLSWEFILVMAEIKAFLQVCPYIKGVKKKLGNVNCLVFPFCTKTKNVEFVGM